MAKLTFFKKTTMAMADSYMRSFDFLPIYMALDNKLTGNIQIERKKFLYNIIYNTKIKSK